MGTMLLDEDRVQAGVDTRPGADSEVRITHTVVATPLGPTTLVAHDGRSAGRMTAHSFASGISSRVSCRGCIGWTVKTAAKDRRGLSRA